MENSSKALILAGEILIGMLVVGLIVFAIVNFGRFAANMNEQIAEDKVVNFNNNFYKYEGRVDITAEEIATIIDYAKHNNDEYDLELNSTRDQYVRVTIDGYDFFSGQVKDLNNKLIKFDYTNSNQFKNGIHTFIESYNETFFKCNVKTAVIEELKNEQKERYGVDYNIKIKEYIDDNALNSDIKTNSRTGLVTSINFSQSNIKSGSLIFNVKNRENFLINMVK